MRALTDGRVASGRHECIHTGLDLYENRLLRFPACEVGVTSNFGKPVTVIELLWPLAHVARARENRGGADAYGMAVVCTTSLVFPTWPFSAPNDGQEKLCPSFSRSMHGCRIEANPRLSYMTPGGI